MGQLPIICLRRSGRARGFFFNHIYNRCGLHFGNRKFQYGFKIGVSFKKLDFYLQVSPRIRTFASETETNGNGNTTVKQEYKHYKKTIMIMKKNIMKAILAMTAMIATFAFTSCSKNDDDKARESSEATVQPILYIAEDMVDNFDITYDIDGQKVAITKANTTAKQTTSEINGKQRVYRILVYTGPTKKVTSFPTTLNYTATVTVKEGVKLQEQESSDFYLSQDFNLGNTSIGDGWKSKVQGNYQYKVKWATVYEKGKLDTYLSKLGKSTYKVQVNSASSITTTPVK